MRDFCKFSPKFWTSAQTRNLVKQGTETALVALYLQTNHHSHYIGIYFLPVSYIARDVGIDTDRIRSILNYLDTIGFCKYDDAHEYIWLIDFVLEQIGASLKDSDKRVIHLQRYFEGLPDLSFKGHFYSKHKDDYHLQAPPEGLRGGKESKKRKTKTVITPFEETSKFLLSKENENETEKEIENQTENDKASLSEKTKCSVIKIFEYWKQTMNHPNAKLDLKRKRTIQQALQSGYDANELQQAIFGCSLTPHNMGENDQGQRFDGLDIILRNADQIDRFVRNAQSPPVKRSASKSNLYESNHSAIQVWLAEETAEEEKNGIN